MKLIFDFDGTLADISRRHYAVYKTVVSLFGGTPMSQATYWKQKRENTPWPKLISDSQLSLNNEKRFLKKFTELIEQPRMLALDELFSDTIETLESLSAHHDLILVSLRRKHVNLTSQLNTLNITHYFAYVLSGHSETKEGVLQKKAEVIRQQGLTDAAFLLGDTEADISAAKQLNIPAIALTTGIRSKSYLLTLDAAYIASSLTEAKNIIEQIEH